MNAKLGDPTGAKFYGKDVRTVTLPDNIEAQAGMAFIVNGVRYSLLQEIGKDPDTKFTMDDGERGSVKFLCYEAHTAEEEWHIKRKIIARSARR